MVRKKQKNIFERHRNANPTPTTSHDASQPAATEEPSGEINMEIPLPNTPQASRPGTPEDFGPTFKNCRKLQELPTLIDLYSATLENTHTLLKKINFFTTAVLQIHKGTTVKVHEDHLWAVLLVTPLICEASSSTITILLSATKAEALPFAVMIHASQSIKNYINAFQLLKMNFPQCLGGQDYPEVFMSDDSSAEKGALTAVWPEAKQLLCHYFLSILS
ncbi:SWIM-type domain-containing protein [Trichonephila clavipes]|nr:SWIM-type domain-containing protein [Trichonephila clavipes]